MSKTSEHILAKIREAKDKQLKELNLTGQDLTEIPAEVFKLEQLEILDLSHNLLTSVSHSISKLASLRELDLSHNQLTGVPQSIGQLQNLTSFNLNQNQFTTIPNSIHQLQNLKELYLAENLVTEVPESISQLKKLTKLVLSSNRLTNIPDVIYTLSSLTELFISNLTGTDNRNKISEISPKILQLENLKNLYLEDNPIEVPPLEIMVKGVEAIKNYFWQLEREGQDYLYEAKLLIVGEGGAGKTTLAKKITNLTYELHEDEESTEGLEVHQWYFSMDNEQRFRVNIWDFGGQEIYHGTHQFFLTKRSLYALVADTRKEDTDFYYWLNIVELLSDNSPLLIIKNEKQDRHREINERQLRGQFTNLEMTLSTNLATNRGLPEIISEIKHYISHLPHIGSPLPKTWKNVRKILEQDPRNYISLDEYLAVCEHNGFTQLKDKLQLSGYLHDLGVCLHFQDDPLLKKIVILKPEWGTVAVYKVLDNKIVIKNLGRFSRTDLDDIWREPKYAKMQDELLQLMINFKLCYQIPDSRDTYIAPQLLTENQPSYMWDESDNLRLRYTYEFMPKGILTRFTVAIHQLIADQRYVWKSGVILLKDETKAEITENYGKREIAIRIAGKYKKELLTIVVYELDKIHDSYRRLRYDKRIPCNCIMCKDSLEPHFYRFEILRQFVDDGQPLIQCQRSYQMIEVLGLIDTVMDKSRLHSKTIGNEIDYDIASKIDNVKPDVEIISGMIDDYFLKTEDKLSRENTNKDIDWWGQLKRFLRLN